ncbi:streptophobe family protein [Streptomyces sp. P10-4]|uniref:streptophobe family protein n=1 Tax=Streptomyces sp. P10-4 TaxID=3421645 RepID=UPI003D29E904
MRADAAGPPRPKTAAVVALGAGGSVTPSGDVSAFGRKAAEARTAVEFTPLGVGLAGGPLPSWVFVRSVHTAGVAPVPAEVLACAGAVVVLFRAVLGGLSRRRPAAGGLGMPGLGGMDPWTPPARRPWSRVTAPGPLGLARIAEGVWWRGWGQQLGDDAGDGDGAVRHGDKHRSAGAGCGGAGRPFLSGGGRCRGAGRGSGAGGAG